MVETNFWTMDRFPVVYEGDKVMDKIYRSRRTTDFGEPSA